MNTELENVLTSLHNQRSSVFMGSEFPVPPGPE